MATSPQAPASSAGAHLLSQSWAGASRPAVRGLGNENATFGAPRERESFTTTRGRFLRHMQESQVRGERVGDGVSLFFSPEPDASPS